MILDPSLFIKTEVMARKVVLPQGEATLHFRRLTSSEMQVLRDGQASQRYDDRANLYAWAISKSLCNPDGSQLSDSGSPVLSESQARMLTQEAFLALMAAVFEVNFSAREEVGAGKLSENADFGTS